MIASPRKIPPKISHADFSRNQSACSEPRQFREIESSPNEINPEKREQHRDAPEEGVEEKLRRRAIALFAAPDFDEQESRHQAHLVKEKPEEEILRGERAVKRRLHDEQQRAKTAAHPLREQREREDQRRQHNQQQAQAVHAEHVFRADARNPGVPFHELHPARRAVVVMPETVPRTTP